MKIRGPPWKAKYDLMIDSEIVPRGKFEKNPLFISLIFLFLLIKWIEVRELKEPETECSKHNKRHLEMKNVVN